jgi:phage/plasmid-associated DNA primase
MPTTFFELLDTLRTPDDQLVTHQGMHGRCKGKYHVPADQTDNFYALYREEALQKQTPNINIIERHGDTGPMVFDIDLKYTGSADPVCTQAFAKAVVDAMYEIVPTWVSTASPDDPNNLYADGFKAYVLVKPGGPIHLPADKGGGVKDGMHIHLPGIIVNPSVQYAMHEDIKADVVQAVQDHLPPGATLVTSPDSILDDSVYQRNGMMLFGSAKPNQQAYRVQDIYVSDGTSAPTALSMSDRADLVQPERLLHTLRLCNDDRPDEVGLSLNGLQKQQTQESLRALTQRMHSRRDDEFQGDDNGQLGIERGRELHQLLSCLSPNRGTEYSDWFKVMCACINSYGPGCWQLFNAWCMQYTMSYDYQKNLKMFDEIVGKRDPDSRSRATKGTLHFMAKQDNPEMYSVLFDMKVIAREIEKSDAGRARMYVHFFGDSTVCVDCGKDPEFRVCCPSTKIWVKMTPNQMKAELLRLEPLLNTFLEDLKQKHADRLEDLIERLSGSDEDAAKIRAMQKRFADVEDWVWKYNKSLNSQGTRSSTIPDLAAMLFDRKFEGQLDQTDGILSVKNGVVDTRVSPPELRARQPSDRLSYCLNIEYDAAAKCPDFTRFLDGIFDNHRLRGQGHHAVAYVCRHLGLALSGFHNLMELAALVLQGKGGNGKSVLLTLINSLCATDDGGSLVFNLSSDCLQAQPGKDGDGAQPGFVNLRGKRFALVDETETQACGGGIVLGMGFKKLCGTVGGTITARALHKMPVTFAQSAGILMCCNNFPDTRNDPAINRRLKAAPMYNCYRPAGFPGHDPVNNPDDILADGTLPAKLLEQLPGILTLLAQHGADGYAAFQAHASGMHGVQMPAAVQEFAQEQLTAGDFTQLFVFQLDSRMKFSSRGDEATVKSVVKDGLGVEAMRALGTNGAIAEKLQVLDTRICAKRINGTEVLLHVAVKGDPEQPAAGGGVGDVAK